MSPRPAGRGVAAACRARGLTAAQVGCERRGVDTQLAGECGDNLRVGRLTHAEHTAGEPRIAELDSQAQLGRGASVAADQLQIVVRQGVAARQGAVIQGGREFGELGALCWSEEFARGHGEARYGIGRGAPLRPASRAHRGKRPICCDNAILDTAGQTTMAKLRSSRPARIFCDDLARRDRRSSR